MHSEGFSYSAKQRAAPPAHPQPRTEPWAGSDGLHCSEGWEHCRGEQGEGWGREETRCQRQDRKDVVGDRSKEGRGS